jgi:disease resistance protein RPM1
MDRSEEVYIITSLNFNSFLPCCLQIELGPTEFLKEVSGTIDSVVPAQLTISSLVLVTNVKTYGPFGPVRGQRFNLTVPENTCVVGFYAKSGGALDSIGVYSGPIQNS